MSELICPQVDSPIAQLGHPLRLPSYVALHLQAELILDSAVIRIWLTPCYDSITSMAKAKSLAAAESWLPSSSPAAWIWPNQLRPAQRWPALSGRKIAAPELASPLLWNTRKFSDLFVFCWAKPHVFAASQVTIWVCSKMRLVYHQFTATLGWKMMIDQYKPFNFEEFLTCSGTKPITWFPNRTCSQTKKHYPFESLNTATPKR